jgi:MoxR-like ATPase
MATFSFATLATIIPAVVDAGFPIMIRGRHGIGKSETVYQFARARSMELVERRASQMTEGDLLGMPQSNPETTEAGNTVTRWNAPDWFVAACERPVVLFLDEVDRATREVRQGIMQLTDSRTINGMRLHPGTVIFAATNGAEHCSAEYDVGELDPAELDRWAVYDVEPTIEDWLSWAKAHVSQLVWDFVNNNRDHLEFHGASEPNKVTPSRRSWKRLDEVLVKAGMAAEPKAHAEAMFALACGFVGFEAAVSLRDFASKYDAQVTVEDILDKPGITEKVAGFELTDHMALVGKLAGAKRLGDEGLTDEQLVRLADWFCLLPSEAAQSFWKTCMNPDDAAQSVVVRFHRTTASCGTTVAKRVAFVMTGKK